MFELRPPSTRSSGGSRPVVISVVVHVVLGAALIRILLIPLPYTNLFGHSHAPPPVVERISFLALPKTSNATNPGRSGGNGVPVSKVPAKPIVAPPTIPTSVPAVPPTATPAPAPTGGSGPVVGTGGPQQGVTPQYHDPRVWVAAAPMSSAPKTTKEKADSLMAAVVQAHNDSMSRVAGRKPGDWTFTHNGQKYGIDQQYIHLGPVSIPNAVLALLPLNHVQGNPMAGAAEQLYNTRHDEIMDNAQKGMDEDAFRTAVRKLRERMDLEKQHQEQQKEQKEQQQQQQSQPNPPQTIAKDP